MTDFIFDYATATVTRVDCDGCGIRCEQDTTRGTA